MRQDPQQHTSTFHRRRDQNSTGLWETLDEIWDIAAATVAAMNLGGFERFRSKQKKGL